MVHTFRFCPKCGSSRFTASGPRSKKCEQCGFEFYFNSSAAVAAFIRNSQGDLLVCVRARKKKKGALDLPGGFVDAAETAEDALKREIMEELHLEVEKMNYLFSIPNVYQYSDADVATLDMFYECRVKDFSPLCASDDVACVSFMPMEEIKVEDFGLQSIKKAVSRFLQKNVDSK